MGADQQAQQRGLAGAIGANQTHPGARNEIDVDRLGDDERTKVLAESADRESERRVHRVSVRPRRR